MTDFVAHSNDSRPDTVGATSYGETALHREAAEAKDYVALLKPRVMTLVVFTALVGMVAAPGGVHPIIAAASIALIAIGAGASAALNMWYDADIDRIMQRTIDRPVPSGRVTANDALALGLVLSFFSVAFLGLIAGITAAILLAITIFFYAGIYTAWLKRRTPQNIVIGGAAGAFPPMIGWAVVSDSVTLQSVALFALIFFWTPAHFWALSLFINNDYEKAGVPMLTVSASRRHVTTQILLYAVLTVAVSLAPSFLDVASPVYGVVAALLGAVFVWRAINVFRGREGSDRAMFLYSISYLFAIFGVLALDVVAQGWLL